MSVLFMCDVGVVVLFRGYVIAGRDYWSGFTKVALNETLFLPQKETLFQ
jgi:hypothetical protein